MREFRQPGIRGTEDAAGTKPFQRPVCLVAGETRQLARQHRAECRTEDRGGVRKAALSRAASGKARQEQICLEVAVVGGRFRDGLAARHHDRDLLEE